MIQLKITWTAKGYSPRDSWQTLDQKFEEFETVNEAKDFLRSILPMKCKRVPMYCDTQSRGTIKCGWVYGFRDADYSHAPVQKWISQVWVEFREIVRRPMGEAPGEVRSIAL